MIRDRIGEFLGDSKVRYEPVRDRDQHVDLLRGKLLEEAIEYVRDPSVGEAADVLDALQALAAIDLEVDWSEVVGCAKAKTEERGGFTEGTVMVVLTTAPSTHENRN